MFQLFKLYRLKPNILYPTVVSQQQQRPPPQIIHHRKASSGVWVTKLPDGLRLAAGENKPIMLFIHRAWCNACKKLVATMRGSAEVKALQANLVTIELTGEDEAGEKKYAPDGEYVPRYVTHTHIRAHTKCKTT